MTKTKVGDKLIDNQGRQWEVEEIDDCSITYENGLPYGCQSCDRLDSWMWFHIDGTDADETGLEIVGFADEQPTEVASENKGVKSDQGKTQWSYLPIPAVKAVVDVMAYGDTKYPAPDGSNWKRVPDAKKRYYNAAMRHLTSWWDGEQNDPETGYNHLAHACSNLLFLLWFEIKGYPETKE